MAYQVFIIENHPILRGICHDIVARTAALEICGEASTGAEAMQLLDYVNPNIILLDIQLPDINGLYLIKQLKASSPALPVLVISGENEEIYASAAKRAGASGYLDNLQVAAALVDTILTLVAQ